MAKRKRTVEWVGAITSMPSYVTGEGEPYRPEVLIWLNPDGLIVGTTLARPGELLGQSAESLRNAIAKPMIGRCPAPTRVRVASSELAEVLRAEMPSIEVECAPTPELAEVEASMREAMAASGSRSRSYLSGGVEPEAVAAFFRAAARLYRARPWEAVPSDQSLIGVTSEALGLEEAPVTIIGQMGESFGFVLFEDFGTFEEYVEVGQAFEEGDEGRIPPHLAVSFLSGDGLAPELKEEVEEYGWDLETLEAYPDLLAMGEGLEILPLNAEDFETAEALCLALPELLADEKAWTAAWSGGPRVETKLTVDTYFGEVDITWSAPIDERRDWSQPSDDLLGDLTKLARVDEIDPEVHEELQQQLIDRFIASPEAKKLPEVGIVSPLMHYAADYLGETIATLDPSGLSEVVFDIFPRKVAVPPSEAREIIEELRAFYEFLGRELGLKQAKACLRVLGGSAVKELRAGLSDPSNFGMAKSMFMSGVGAGFEMETEEGSEAWRKSVKEKPVPDSARLPAEPPAPSSRDNKAKKDKTKEKRKRKAARKARKRNR